MALGFSGSNGEISELNANSNLLNKPIEVSYFVNNNCNLKCKHCYVGYQEQKGDLSVSEWKNIFDSLIGMGALTFGNVGKEPLLSPEKSIELMRHLKKRRAENSRLRFGFVTNGTLLEGKIIEEISDIIPDYIDVSIDGTKEAHDFIRGEGSYSKTIKNLKRLPNELLSKVFISYTLMKNNKIFFKSLVHESSDYGLNKFLVSPYVPSQSANTSLYLNDGQVVDFYHKIVNGVALDFSNLSEIEILLKSDYDSQKHIIDKLVEHKIIDVNTLLIDDYGVIFNRYSQVNGSKVILNYIPFSDTLTSAIRISHDGYVGGCLEMFHEDYSKRAKANLKDVSIEEILKK